jgi:hypothetical protein
MPQRLVDTYRVGDAVEVFLGGPTEGAWHAARVLALQHPGVWVQTADGGGWFVTNSRRIRSGDRSDEQCSTDAPSGDELR